ncbi:MAG: YsnF/AvaK domain-containing protein [Myxococcota bacterium]|nr:YsnF/AvaK domain-containing protein [Myxococcota bacterium]
MAKTVVGLFDRTNADRVVKELDQAGFSRGDIETRSNRLEGSTTALTHIGVPDRDAEVYSDAIKNGATLITLKASDARADEAAAIMKGIEPWSVGAKAKGAKATTKGATGTEQVIPVVEEQLVVGKREAETSGGVRIFTHMVEKPVQEQVTLREEHVNVERRPVDRAATEKDLAAAARDNTIELTERAEQAVVGKTARVVEEVRVGKEVEQHTETVGDTVRRTEVEIEPIRGGQRTSSGWDTESRELRKHYDSNYGSTQGARWESYEPAYRMGHEMSSDRRYASRDWNAVERDARTSWEAKEPGTWERVKGAVRHAFDRGRAKMGSHTDRRV